KRVPRVSLAAPQFSSGLPAAPNRSDDGLADPGGPPPDVRPWSHARLVLSAYGSSFWPCNVLAFVQVLRYVERHCPQSRQASTEAPRATRPTGPRSAGVATGAVHPVWEGGLYVPARG